MSGRRTRPAAPADERGFALVEALASLVVVGMISLMLVSGVTTGRRVWERMDTREASGEALDGAQVALRDRIEQAFPLAHEDVSPPAIAFQGERTRLTFLANPPQAQRPGPLRLYTLWLDGAGALRLSSTPDAGPGAGGPPADEILVRDVGAVEIAYFGADPGGPRGWRSLWRGAGALPDLVRVRLTFAPGDSRRWPDLIVHPQATVDTACLLNTITHRCKGRL